MTQAVTGDAACGSSEVQRDSTDMLIFGLIGAVILPDKAVAVIILCAAVLIVLTGRLKEVFSCRINAAAAFAACVALIIPSVLSLYPYGILAGLAVLSTLVIGLFLASIMTRERMERMLDAMLALSAVAAVYGVYCQIARILELGRVASIFENPNYYANAIELFVPAAACRFITTRKPVYLIMSAVNVSALLLCGCRTAWPALVAAAAVYALLWLKKLWTLAAAAGTGLLTGTVLLLMPGIGARLTADAVSHSLDNRMRYWGNAFRWFTERPLTGWGVGSYQMLSESEGEKILAHAHNMLLNILLDTGIFGIAALCFALYLIIRKLRFVGAAAELRPYMCLAAAAATATLLHGMTDFPAFGVSTALLLAMIMSSVGLFARK